MTKPIHNSPNLNRLIPNIAVFVFMFVCTLAIIQPSQGSSLAPFGAQSFSDTIANENADRELKQLFTLVFDHPPVIEAGSKFIFSVTFVKLPGYRPMGSIAQRWPAGFSPAPAALDYGKMQVDGQQVTISWEKLPGYGEVTFSYPVEVSRLSSGMYPVISEYKDVLGLFVNRTAGLQVSGVVATDVTITPQPPVENVPARISLRAAHPLEIEQETFFEMEFTITKGKTVAPAQLEIKLPPGFRPAQNSGLNYSFNEPLGSMVVSWDNMPPNPSFQVTVGVEVGKPRHAVYPLCSRLIIDGRAAAMHSGYVFVSRELGAREAIDIPIETEFSEVDTSGMFSDIDRLLYEWLAATSGMHPDTVKTLAEESAPEAEPVEETPPVETDTPEIIDYRIQVYASTVKTAGLREQFQTMGINEVLNADFDGRMYRYTLGKFTTRDAARDYLRFLQSKGIEDAFIVRYVNGQRQN